MKRPDTGLIGRRLVPALGAVHHRQRGRSQQAAATGPRGAQIWALAPRMQSMHANRTTFWIISLEGFHGGSGEDLKEVPGVSGGFRYSPLTRAVKFYCRKCIISGS